MRAFFHADQQLHNPLQFMRAGRIANPTDLPARTDALLKALGENKIDVETPPDFGLEPLLKVHSRDYLSFLETAFEKWQAVPNAGPEVLPNTFPYWNATPGVSSRGECRPQSIIARTGYYLGDLAVPVGPKTWQSCLTSAHSAVAAADAVLGGDVMSYALCRPSGHHARSDRASGFCYLNNSAIAAERLRTRFHRVAVLDVDAHHGDGTQAIFYGRSDVMTLSIHADPSTYYPFFTGYDDERGIGDGVGANLNIPLQPGMGDDEFAAAMKIAAPAIRNFRADALVLALGFDGHANDPIGVLRISDKGFRMVGEAVKAFKIPTVVVQEGGYAIADIGSCLNEFLAGAR
ncbi:MAG: histone deacetylase family protein [Rhodospirillaceae bacterium]|nr:histone deacetylase family protein [Rhodospirillaceae bacterium]